MAVAVGVVALLIGAHPAAAAAPLAPRLAPAACHPVSTSTVPFPPETVWPLRRLQPELAWPLSTGRGVVVAVIDSGVSDDPPWLAGKVQDGVDFAPDGAITGGVGKCDESDAGHGTLVASIIAGRRIPDDDKFYGVAPDATILPIRVTQKDTPSRQDTFPGLVAQAITKAVDKGAKVINLSLASAPTAELQNAVNYALSKKVVLVAAAGNGGSQGQQPAYPAMYDGVLAVAGIDEHDKQVLTSLPGNYVKVAAPGVKIVGPTALGGGCLNRVNGGTSFAAPYVSGVAALILSYDSTATPEEVIRRIIQTADHPPEGWNPEVGYGVVNPYRAVASIIPPKDFAPVEPTGALPAAPNTHDPLRSVKLAATWIAVLGIFAAAFVLAATATARLGRARGWRPR